MNEIEKKCFDAFREFAKSKPKIELRYANKIHLYDLELSYDSESTELGIFINASLVKGNEQQTKTFHLQLHADTNQTDEDKADFLITEELFGSLGFAVKIADYEQIKARTINDWREDRVFLKSNIIPIRFMPSEFRQYPEGCVKGTFEIIGKVLSNYKDVYTLGFNTGRESVND